MIEGDIFLDVFQGDSVDALIELQETHRIDSLVLAAASCLYDRKELGESISEAEYVILAVEAFETELNNGGFDQFFSNSSVEYAAIITNSLSVIGCTKVAILADEAIKLLNLETITPDMIRDKMEQEEEQLENSLDELDNQFYSCEEPIAYKLFEYMKLNRELIKLV